MMNVFVRQDSNSLMEIVLILLAKVLIQIAKHVIFYSVQEEI